MIKRYALKYFNDEIQIVEGKCLQPDNCTCYIDDEPKCYITDLNQLKSIMEEYYIVRLEELKEMSVEDFNKFIVEPQLRDNAIRQINIIKSDI